MNFNFRRPTLVLTILYRYKGHVNNKGTSRLGTSMSTCHIRYDSYFRYNFYSRIKYKHSN